jgi:hypothetical protein
LPNNAANIFVQGAYLVETMTEETHHPTPAELLQTKDRLLVEWSLLPPEHQATMLLVLLNTVMQTDLAEWVSNALIIRSSLAQELQRPLTFPLVTRDELTALPLTDEQLALFTESDLTEISRRMHNHYQQDLFWEELAFHTHQILAEKHAAT